LLEAVKKICGALDIRFIEKTVLPRSHASNGAGEVTVKVIRRHATLLIQLHEKSCGLGEVLGCHHPRYQRVLLHNCWHNRFVVRQGHTAYELCADRPFTGRLALFGERVLGFLKLSTKGSPTWTEGIWLGKTASNDVHIIPVRGSPQWCGTRSVRRLPKPWDMRMVGEVEASPWPFGYASLGAQLILSKRISAPPILSLPPARPKDLDAKAVMGVPQTPNEVGDAAPKHLQVLPRSVKTGS